MSPTTSNILTATDAASLLPTRPETLHRLVSSTLALSSTAFGAGEDGRVVETPFAADVGLAFQGGLRTSKPSVVPGLPTRLRLRVAIRRRPIRVAAVVEVRRPPSQTPTGVAGHAGRPDSGAATTAVALRDAQTPLRPAALDATTRPGDATPRPSAFPFLAHAGPFPLSSPVPYSPFYHT